MDTRSVLERAGITVDDLKSYTKKELIEVIMTQDKLNKKLLLELNDYYSDIKNVARLLTMQPSGGEINERD